jgi:hypothetical protein
VVNADWRGIHEAAGRSGAWRYGEFTVARLGCHPGHLHMAKRTRSAQSRAGSLTEAKDRAQIPKSNLARFREIGFTGDLLAIRK